MSMYLVFALSFLMTFFETRNFKIVREEEMKHFHQGLRITIFRIVKSWPNPNDLQIQVESTGQASLSTNHFFHPKKYKPADLTCIGI